MWNIFGHKHQEEDSGEEKPDIELLNDNCFECSHCHSVLSLINYTPLSMGECSECKANNFIPYFVKNYWLYRPLGGGGMGSVYKAIHWNNPNMEFAVKVLPRGKLTDRHLIESLLREAKLGEKFGRHPHLTFIAEYGNYNNEYFCAMEFCKGKRLDQIIESSDPISQKFVLLWALQILSAEQRMYDCGFLYRDLKPQNIIIDPEGNACLIDYGLCLSVEEAHNAPSGEVVDGSPLYMPPERIIGIKEEMSGEIYSLGMVMYHALARKTYYTATGAYALAKKHVSSLRIAGVESRLPISVSPKLSSILDKMLARAPASRYQTYKEAAADIKKVYNLLKE